MSATASVASSNLISQLRQNPDQTVKVYDFYFDFRGVANVVIQAAKEEGGGLCTFTSGLANRDNVVSVGVVNGGTDYFFPWVPRGVGLVEVPVSAPDGTIVSTGQLNGCTFEVIQKGAVLYFYHDGDSKFLRKTVQPVAGQTLCKITPAEYSPTNLGATIMGITQKIADAKKDVTHTRAFCYQMFAVKQAGAWKVYSCGLLLFNGTPRESFQDGASKLMATFTPTLVVG